MRCETGSILLMRKASLKTPATGTKALEKSDAPMLRSMQCADSIRGKSRLETLKWWAGQGLDCNMNHI